MLWVRDGCAGNGEVAPTAGGSSNAGRAAGSASFLVLIRLEVLHQGEAETQNSSG